MRDKYPRSIATPLPRPSAAQAPSEGALLAVSDSQAISTWIAEYAASGGSPHTIRAYRFYADLLLGFCDQHGLALAELKREHIMAMERGLSDRASIEGGRVRQMSQNSADRAMRILSRLFSYLCDAGYLQMNPIAGRRVRAGASSRSEPSNRSLGPQLWTDLLAYAQDGSLRAKTPRQAWLAERDLWCLKLLGGLALRRSEAVSLTLGSFSLDDHGRWWVSFTGKGGKTARLPVTSELTNALARWLHSNRCPSLSLTSAIDSFPLWPTLPASVTADWMGKMPDHISDSCLYRRVTDAFCDYASKIERTDARSARTLRRATPHWIRHTTASNLITSGVDLVQVRDFARHANISTTSRYLHADEEALHAAIQKAAGANN